MTFRLTVDGDAEGGWMVDIHDGTTNAVYRPEGPENDREAAMAALAMHFPETKEPAPPPEAAPQVEPDPMPVHDLPPPEPDPSAD